MVKISLHTVVLQALLLCLLAVISGYAQDTPFNVQAALSRTNQTDALLFISYTIPAGYHLYDDMMSIDFPDGVILKEYAVPPPEKKYDPLSEEEREMYEHDFTAVYLIDNLPDDPLNITVDYQGCDATMCFLPESVQFTLSAGKKPASPTGLDAEPDTAGVVEPAGDWKTLMSEFTFAGSAAGYLRQDAFISFLDKVEAGEADTDQTVIDTFKSRGILISVFLIVLGGFLLNLTPCVLPMIPINLGIIGAGVQAGTRKRGFALGGMFGLGIALVYGLLGLIVVFTGSQFGTINSTWWFNLGIAAIFIVLSLAMFDVITIDFTKYQHSASSGWTNKGTIIAAFMLGSITALLAGACVAPVVIQVLILSADFYSRGIQTGLFLPFLLGIGMAFPWPFAGAGLSFLPKPGVWMTRVKYGFGILIVLFACWYGWVGIKAMNLFTPATGTVSSTAAGQVDDEDHLPHLSSLPDALRVARKENKPVFIDFWATWCKNCTAMDKTTFNNVEVRQRLASYIVVKYQAEKPDRQPAKAVLDYFNVKGLPTYIILQPDTSSTEL